MNLVSEDPNRLVCLLGKCTGQVMETAAQLCSRCWDKNLMRPMTVIRNSTGNEDKLMLSIRTGSEKHVGVLPGCYVELQWPVIGHCANIQAVQPVIRESDSTLEVGPRHKNSPFAKAERFSNWPNWSLIQKAWGRMWTYISSKLSADSYWWSGPTLQVPLPEAPVGSREGAPLRQYWVGYKNKGGYKALWSFKFSFYKDKDHKYCNL